MIVSNNVKVIATIASIAVLSCASSVSYGKIKHSETRSTEVRDVGIRGIIIDKARLMPTNSSGWLSCQTATPMPRR